ncbi:hypothetical protein CEXT_93951 [Caerostris extrusa]|uniref:Uncharacterized protein n=1 Tax=Caerostris extrusa TaxID=172846 RepID=A0AAV4U7S2_CAEEX|nr:hypothetical protein CEXT_93951 [Caerostris extrusa]
MGVENQTSGQTSPPNRGRTPPQLPGYGATTMPHSPLQLAAHNEFCIPLLQGTANVIVMWCGTHIKRASPYRGSYLNINLSRFKNLKVVKVMPKAVDPRTDPEWQIETWRHSRMLFTLQLNVTTTLHLITGLCMRISRANQIFLSLIKMTTEMKPHWCTLVWFT